MSELHPLLIIAGHLFGSYCKLQREGDTERANYALQLSDEVAEFVNGLEAKTNE